MAASVHSAIIEAAYGAHRIRPCLSFSLAPGAIGCLLGPSAAARPPVLRCLAGFEPVQGGESRCPSAWCRSGGLQVPPEQRDRHVFQDYALFPHLTVAGNVRSP